MSEQQKSNGEILQPELRFKGFTEAWRPQKLLELAESYSGGTPSVNNSSYYDGKIPFIRSGEIHSTCTELNITEHGLKKSSAKMVNRGDILYALYGATSGEVAISKIKGAVNQAILVLKPQGHNSLFICNWLGKQKKEILSTYLQGGQGNLSAKIIKSLQIAIPNEEEQKNIGEFFQTLDLLIAKNQRKLELLEKLKKGYQQKIFSQELRFEGFKDSWEEQKLSDVAEVIGGGTPSSANSKYWNGDINWFTPNEIGDTVYVNESKRKITNLGIQRSSAKLLPTGTILMSSRAGIGTMAILSGQACTNQGFQSLIPQKANSYFLYSLQPVISKIANRFASGSTFTEISGRQVANLRLNLPKEQEQKKIGLFFKALDSLTAGEVKKLGDIQTKKRAYLQKLFI